MKTKEEYAQQCRDENPEMIQTVNGEARKLDNEEYEEAIEAWALSRWYQDNPDQQPIQTPLI